MTSSFETVPCSSLATLADREMDSGLDTSARLARLEHESAIAAIARRIGWVIDHGTAEELLSCLTHDAVVESRDSVGGEIRASYAGARGLAEYAARVTAESSRPKAHIVSVTNVSVTGGVGLAESYYVRLSSPEGVPQLAAYGRYFDEFVWSDDSKWRLRRRVAVKDVALKTYK
jgi:hypothetical protein